MMGPLLSSFQHIVGPNMRATASAIALFINNLVGIGFGSLLIGILSDFLSEQFAEEALRYSLASGVIFYLVAAFLFLLAARHLEGSREPLPRALSKPSLSKSKSSVASDKEKIH